jgi:hypothetical protein
MIYIYAALVGFVSAGFAGSLWGLVRGREPDAALLLDRSLMMPAGVLALVFHAPILILKSGCFRFAQGRLFGLGLIAIALGWCFLQGVFVLTQVFGIG